MITALSKPIATGGQPDPETIARLAHDGFRSILNLRRENEKEQPLPPAAEGKVASYAGLAYAHVPVGGPGDPAALDAALDALAQLPAPIFVHCGGGTRALAVALLQLGLETGRTGDSLLAFARKEGLAFDDADWIESIFRHLNRRIAASG